MIPEADVSFFPDFFDEETADQMLAAVRVSSDWEERVIHMYGHDVPLPRRVAWYGDPEATYSYSGIVNVPKPWTLVLQAIREEVEKRCQTTFNSVLLNRYRTGKDSIAWHADDEPELGDNPVIASVSFGATRNFRFKHKRRRDLTASIALTHGSLLVMRGPTQGNWFHCVPKTKKIVGERINLTFRVVRPR